MAATFLVLTSRHVVHETAAVAFGSEGIRFVLVIPAGLNWREIILYTTFLKLLNIHIKQYPLMLFRFIGPFI